jgi:hypothetical protein
MAIDNLKQSIVNSIGNVSEQFRDSFFYLKNLKEASAEKVNTLVNGIFGMAHLIEETGFIMKDVSVDISIPPSISLSFGKEKEIEPETIEKLLEDNKDKEILRLIVTALQKADAAQKSMNLQNYVFKGLSMKLGLPPDISLKFEKK